MFSMWKNMPIKRFACHETKKRNETKSFSRVKSLAFKSNEWTTGCCFVLSEQPEWMSNTINNKVAHISFYDIVL